MTDPTDEPTRLVTRRQAMQGTGVALGSYIASGRLTDAVLAQSGGPSNEISGTVEDSGGPVQGATVVAVPHDTSLSALETTTDANGDYIFAQSDLHTGSNLYHVIARDGTETDPRRGVPNYPFIAAEGPAAIPDSAVLHWRMDEGSGGIVYDDIGSANATLDGGTWDGNADYVGDYRINLDGVDDWIAPTGNGTAIGDGADWSAGLTVHADSALSTEQMAWSWSDGTIAFGVYHQNGNLSFSYYDGASYNHVSHSEPSAPYTVRLFATFDASASSIELYLNDGASTGTAGGPVFTLDSNLVVGSDQDKGSRFLGAYVDDFITMSEIEDPTQDYNRQPWS